MRRSDKREFLMLAHRYDPEKHNVSQWYASIKMNGMLAYWDGGITFGLPVAEVPFANADKTASERIATGLWSRYGKPISAPDEFLRELPPCPMAGELYWGDGPGNYQKTMSVVRKHIPVESEWRDVNFHVFDLPSFGDQFTPGRIHCREWRVTWNLDVLTWVKTRARKFSLLGGHERTQMYAIPSKLRAMAVDFRKLRPIEQIELPVSPAKAAERVKELFDARLAEGHEGLILRHPTSIWSCERSHDYLKVKPKYEGTARVAGWRSGKVTADGSKNLGRLGSLLVIKDGIHFEVSGFTDAERELPAAAAEWARNNPDDIIPAILMVGCNFPYDSEVVYSYTELSDSGVPKSANISRGVD